MAVPRAKLYIDGVLVRDVEDAGNQGFVIYLSSIYPNCVCLSNNGATDTSIILWEYSGAGTFLGLATSSSASTPTYDGTEDYIRIPTGSTYLYSIADLTGTTWEFIEYPEMNYGDIEYNINFISNTNFYYSIKTSSDGVDGYLYYKNSSNSYINVYDYSLGEWTNEVYRTIAITGGTDVTNSTLRAWLEANATLITYDPVTWKFKHYIADTVPDPEEPYLHLYFNYYCELTVADMSNCCAFVSAGVLTPFSTWQELVVQLPGALEEFGATNVTSTLSASSVPADYKTKWSTIDCGFYGNDTDGYWFGPNSGWTITEYPDITGTISFTFDGSSYNLNFTQLLQAIIDVTGTSLFDSTVWIYDRETGYTCEGMRTITITGGDDAEDVDLLTWLQANAVEVIPFTEGVRVTYNGDVIKQLDTDGAFSLSCANKLMASNITIETLNVGSIVVTYDNDTIIDSSGTHIYQLPCNKKMADTDIVVTVVMTVLPDNLLITSEGNYIVDVNDGYLITTTASYSGTITGESKGPSPTRETYIKFGSAPTSTIDYTSGTGTSNGVTWWLGDTAYSNETKVYVWGTNSGITPYNIEGGNNYSSAVEVALTHNGAIQLWNNSTSGGGGN